MRSWPKLMPALIYLCLLVLACAGAPTMEMDAAKTAIQRAKQAGADVYAPEELSEAEDLLAQAEAKINQKNYAEARTLALRAKRKADEAEGMVERNKIEMKKEAEKVLYEVDLRIKAIRGNMNRFRPKFKAAEVKQVNISLEQLEKGLEQVRNYLAQGEITRARDQANSVKENSLKIQASVLETIGSSN